MSLEYKTEYFEELESTNKYAKERARKGAPEGTAIIAKKQSGGYGRLGRSFYSPDSSGLYMSLILRPCLPAGDAILITAAAAAAVSRAIEYICGKKTDIKWVNDIFLDGKKVCGILCESSFEPLSSSLEFVVLGIGINLYTPEKGFPEEIKKIAGPVFSQPCDDEIKSKLISLIFEYFDQYYKDLPSKEYYKIYKEKCFIIGKEVAVTRENKSYTCRVTDLDTDMHLRVCDKEGNEHILDSGEISIKI